MNEHNLKYLTGFGNHFSTEAIEGVLPQGQNAPQQVSKGLYAEQFSATAFTRPRDLNQRSWFYRIRPSVVHGGEPVALSLPNFRHFPVATAATPPKQMRFAPLPAPSDAVDFIHSLITIVANPAAAIHLYHCNQSSRGQFFCNNDSEMMFVPQQGQLQLRTEQGELIVAPGEIVVIPRGICLQINSLADAAAGYLCENYQQEFRLPDLGPIGANGLANPRDFLTPVAAYEDQMGPFVLINKYQGQLWSSQISHSPLDVVAWHGNVAPYKYDLSLFNTINTVSYDHPDPSIFTVLTAPSGQVGIANIDFVIFPERWMVAEHSFRPPYYHRNMMSEYMGLIKGQYDAKQTGFAPGGCSVHNCMVPHGPDSEAFVQALEAQLKPEYYQNTLAFMFESMHAWQLSDAEAITQLQDSQYRDCWKDLPVAFAP